MMKLEQIRAEKERLMSRGKKEMKNGYVLIK